MNILIFTWIVCKVAIYCLVHPLWTFHWMKSVFNYYRRKGDFADTDFYKITMGQLFWRHYKDVWAEYVWTLRTVVPMPDGFADQLKKRVNHRLTYHHSLNPEIGQWLKTIDYLDHDYIDWLMSGNRYANCTVTITQEGDSISIRYLGPVVESTHLEIPILYMVSQLYREMTGQKRDGIAWVVRAWSKAQHLRRNCVKWADFGTRRRDSFFVQFVVVLVQYITGWKRPQDQGGIIGTSNVFIAYALNWKAMGTIAHETMMIAGALYGPDRANQLVVSQWLNEYPHAPGYYLPDTFTTEQFLKDVSPEQIIRFTGGRQDSGDPAQWTRLMAKYYQQHVAPIQPDRVFGHVYSDGLNHLTAPIVCRLAKAIGFDVSVGIGTNNTNDVGLTPLNMVIKPYRVWLASDPDNTRYCVKLSDTKGKITGDAQTAKAVARWVETGDRSHLPTPLS